MVCMVLDTTPCCQFHSKRYQRVSTWVQAWVAPHLYHRVVLRDEFAAYSFLQAMASERVPLLRTFVHTLVVSRVRYTWYHFKAVEQDETCEAKFEAEGYYPDGPYASQIFQILQCLNDPTCRQSWQNLLVNQGLLPGVETTTCLLPPQLTITGVGEIYWAHLDFSNVRQLRFPDYMIPFNRARHIWTQFPSLTHLGMVVYTDPPIARRVVEVLLQSQTLERLAVVILPLPSAPSNAVRSMGNAIYRGLLEVDDERLVVLEEEISILKMLRQPDGVPFWRMVDKVAEHVKENGKNRSFHVL